MNTPPPLPSDDERAAHFDAAMALLGLTVEPAWRPAALANLKMLAEAAQLVREFPLDDEAEPAPVFSP